MPDKTPPDSPEDEAPIQIAVRRRTPVKTAPLAPQAPKTASSNDEGEIKIHFKNKKPTRPTPANNSIQIVKKRKISVSVFSDDEPLTKPAPAHISAHTPIHAPTHSSPTRTRARIAAKARIASAHVSNVPPAPAEPELPDLEAPIMQDLDLEDVFNELEQGAKSETLFDDFANPLDKKEETEKASEPQKNPEPKKVSPFISSVRVDKRPLSGVRPVAPPNDLIVEKKVPASKQQSPAHGNLGVLQKPAAQQNPHVTTAIAAAPKKTSTIGLFLAVLATVIAGGFVGALIYFWFFQE